MQFKEIEIQKLYEKATVNMDQQLFLLRCYTDTICTCTGEASDSSQYRVNIYMLLHRCPTDQ